MKLGLVLLPDADVSAKLERYARVITELGGQRSCLGENALAHVSLVHVESDLEPEIVWKEVSQAVGQLQICTCHVWASTRSSRKAAQASK